MAFITHTARDIEATARALQDELQRLEAQQHGLERELAAVLAHLGSVRRALGALQKLMPTESRDLDDVTGGSVPVPVTHPAESAATQGTYGRLTEQILEYLATTGGTEVRARDVAAALGRDANAGSINAVRSTLDRLVGASRVRRTGRGLYRAAS
ncbi:hypothetical protein ACIP98_13390 [Streptomyces sp. NPDC088354]|uniref:hypothetical protein n=1 Tax=unclassified Streptomyces TaxID=2593676 RepID=UPI0029A55BEC|nr:hypothetical protein [Streptomyces sp. MI02-7b]MDX3071154.1 hypothetical protein [Streptomyces sp. MI02-7b]